MRGFLLLVVVFVGVLILADVLWTLAVALGLPAGLQNYVSVPLAIIATVLVARRRTAP
jgi:uncharacterized protein (DUF983 family)